jgi:hypothetical protein
MAQLRLMVWDVAGILKVQKGPSLVPHSDSCERPTFISPPCEYLQGTDSSHNGCWGDCR